jgi:hypothetical protein
LVVSWNDAADSQLSVFNEAWVIPCSVGLETAGIASRTSTASSVIFPYPVVSSCDGILRARYRNSLAQPDLLDPGRVYEYRVQLGSTSYVFAPGFRIRLEISSSNFPRFDRNLNTGGDFASESVARPAVQHVFHGGVRASQMVLPIVPQA